MSYARNCSCCGDYISIDQIKFLKETGEYDSEGNHCDRCYNEIAMGNQLQLMEIIQKVADSFKNPLNRFKFLHTSFEHKTRMVFKLMDKGIITFQIGGF